MSINGLDDKQILTFMQLTSGKTYTFVGTSGDYSDYMCVTAGMFAEPSVNITKWAIEATITMSGTTDIYIGYEEAYADNNEHCYFLPSNESYTIANVQDYTNDFMTGSWNAFQIRLGDSIQFGNYENVSMGVTTNNPFQMITLGSGNFNVNGSVTNKNVTKLGTINQQMQFNVTGTTTSSSGASTTFTATLAQRDINTGNYYAPAIHYGGGSSNYLEKAMLNFTWSIRFSNFRSNATLYTGRNSSGRQIKTTEVSERQVGNTLYRKVNITIPPIDFVGI